VVPGALGETGQLKQLDRKLILTSFHMGWSPCGVARSTSLAKEVGGVRSDVTAVSGT